MAKTKVSIVNCHDYDPTLVKNALEDSLKNIGFTFKKNMNVLIKPNVLSPVIPKKATTTHPVIIEALCKILKTYGAKIVIGDSSGFNTDKSLVVSGIKRLEKYGPVVNFEHEDKKFFLIGKKRKHKIPLSRLVFDCDLVINVAKLKTHSLTKVTLAVKNLYGCIPGRMKSFLHQKIPDMAEFADLLLGIESVIKPGLNIIDGIIGLEGEGPGTSGTPIKSNVILASSDARSLDYAAARLMGFDPRHVMTIRKSKIKIDDITLVGNSKDLKLNFKKPIFSPSAYFRFASLFLPKIKIGFNNNLCKQCRVCEEKCPVAAIHLSPYPMVNHKKCIRCFCCMEVCPHKAILVKKPWIRSQLNNLGKKLRLID